MSVASMTGFARATGHDGAYEWAWEVKSVNGRGLDLRCRMPSGFDHLEAAVREAAAARFRRGSLTLGLSVTRGPGRLQLVLNREILDQLIRIVRELENEVPAAPPRLDGLLAMRGVVETAEQEEPEEDRVQREAAMIDTLEEALGALASVRIEEGSRLLPILTDRLDEIATLCAAAERAAAAQPEAVKERLRLQVAELLEAASSLSEDRLMQEAAILATKVDTREEIDRLKTHIASARDLLVGGGAVGRRLDFLCQELNREANTLCAKSVDVELTHLGLEIKAQIEQLREQVQNVE